MSRGSLRLKAGFMGEGHKCYAENYTLGTLLGSVQTTDGSLYSEVTC